MKKSIPARPRRWLVLPPIVLGAAVVIWLTQHAQTPQRRPQQEVARVLRVIEAPAVDVIPRVLGYGTAKPARVWRAVAEVEGRVIKVHSELKPGAFVKEGEGVLEIDPREYELVVSRLEAEIAENEANLAELETQKENDSLSLEIEKASLRLAQADLDRVTGVKLVAFSWGCGVLVARGAEGASDLPTVCCRCPKSDRITPCQRSRSLRCATPSFAGKARAGFTSRSGCPPIRFRLSSESVRNLCKPCDRCVAT